MEVRKTNYQSIVTREFIPAIEYIPETKEKIYINGYLSEDITLIAVLPEIVKVSKKGRINPIIYKTKDFKFEVR